MKIDIDSYKQYLSEHYCGKAHNQGMFMKLVEEVGEVAEVLNKMEGYKALKASDDLKKELAYELADVIHYVVALAAINEIDLAKTIIDKDAKAAIKYQHQENLQTFISKHSSN